MKKVIVLALLALFVSSVASAQSIQRFVISTSAAGYGDVKGNQAVMVAGAGFQLTPESVSLGFLSISNPSDTTQPRYNLGVANYSKPLSSFLGKKVSSKLAFDASNWGVTIQAGAGKVNYEKVNRIAEEAGIYLGHKMSNNLIMSGGYMFLHGAGSTVVKMPTIGFNVVF